LLQIDTLISERERAVQGARDAAQHASHLEEHLLAKIESAQHTAQMAREAQRAAEDRVLQLEADSRSSQRQGLSGKRPLAEIDQNRVRAAPDEALKQDVDRTMVDTKVRPCLEMQLSGDSFAFPRGGEGRGPERGRHIVEQDVTSHFVASHNDERYSFILSMFRSDCCVSNEVCVYVRESVRLFGKDDFEMWRPYMYKLHSLSFMLLHFRHVEGRVCSRPHLTPPFTSPGEKMLVPTMRTCLC
jgi:hypothetical protein